MDPVIEVVERSNQRGGRMLSVLDLIEADTLTPELTAWLLARIEEGASWMVGAVPGGAGKTTIMSALLAMLPDGERVRLADSRGSWKSSRPGECVVAYEISPGAYLAYVWGEEVRRLAELAASGVRVVTNLHADTLEQARAQVVEDNGVAPKHFDAIDLFLPISLQGGLFSMRPRVESVFHSAGEGFRTEVGGKPEMGEREKEILDFLAHSRKEGLRRVEEMRRAWLEWTRA